MEDEDADDEMKMTGGCRKGLKLSENESVNAESSFYVFLCAFFCFFFSFWFPSPPPHILEFEIGSVYGLLHHRGFRKDGLSLGGTEWHNCEL